MGKRQYAALTTLNCTFNNDCNDVHVNGYDAEYLAVSLSFFLSLCYSIYNVCIRFIHFDLI